MQPVRPVIIRPSKCYKRILYTRIYWNKIKFRKKNKLDLSVIFLSRINSHRQSPRPYAPYPSVRKVGIEGTKRNGI